MAVEKGINPFSWPASGTLATKQYYCVNLASDGEVQVQTTKGGQVMGVLQNDPAAVGRAAQVQTIAGSQTKVIASTTATAAIAIGNALICSTLGKVIKATTGGTAFVIGRATEAVSTGKSVIASMLLTMEGPSSTA